MAMSDLMMVAVMPVEVKMRPRIVVDRLSALAMPVVQRQSLRQNRKGERQFESGQVHRVTTGCSALSLPPVSTCGKSLLLGAQP